MHHLSPTTTGSLIWDTPTNTASGNNALDVLCVMHINISWGNTHFVHFQSYEIYLKAIALIYRYTLYLSIYQPWACYWSKEPVIYSSTSIFKPLVYPLPLPHLPPPPFETYTIGAGVQCPPKPVNSQPPDYNLSYCKAADPWYRQACKSFTTS